MWRCCTKATGVGLSTTARLRVWYCLYLSFFFCSFFFLPLLTQTVPQLGWVFCRWSENRPLNLVLRQKCSVSFSSLMSPRGRQSLNRLNFCGCRRLQLAVVSLSNCTPRNTQLSPATPPHPFRLSPGGICCDCVCCGVIKWLKWLQHPSGKVVHKRKSPAAVISYYISAHGMCPITTLGQS